MNHFLRVAFQFYPPAAPSDRPARKGCYDRSSPEARARGALPSLALRAKMARTPRVVRGLLMQRVQVIDSHTGGEPTRVVIAGGPDLGSGSLAERRAIFRDHF